MKNLAPIPRDGKEIAWNFMKPGGPARYRNGNAAWRAKNAVKKIEEAMRDQAAKAKRAKAEI